MSKVIQSLREVNFSIEDAARAGYSVDLRSDGNADLATPTGAVYRVRNFRCDCPDALHRNGGSFRLPDGSLICKHIALLTQFRPCPICGKVQILTGTYFDCLNRGCCYATDARLVREPRGLRRGAGGMFPQMNVMGKIIMETRRP